MQTSSKFKLVRFIRQKSFPTVCVLRRAAGVVSRAAAAPEKFIRVAGRIPGSTVDDDRGAYISVIHVEIMKPASMNVHLYGLIWTRYPWISTHTVHLKDILTYGT